MRKILIIISVCIAVSCSNNSGTEKDTTANSVATTPIKNEDVNNDAEGVQGIINVPEILTLSIRDTATMQNISERMGNAYTNIQEDLTELKLDVAGSPGALYYTNDPQHFLFECVIPIAKTPNGKPKRSELITLEPIRAVLFNYYGSYEKLFTAYEKLKNYLNENKLIQNGAAREFYITDIALEKDTTKWLTKIYIPLK